MKRALIIYILLAGLLVLVIGACTPPPPENPKDDEPVVETDPVTPEEVTPIEEEETGGKGPGETTTLQGEDGTASTGTGMTPPEPAIDEPEVETPAVEIEIEGIFPDDLFGGYDAWPPDSITADEVAMLDHALVVFETTKGLIKVKPFPNEAPLHSANLVKLVQDGFYDNLVFHRVISDFMSQGGDPDGTGSGGPGYTLPAEIGLPHIAGSMSAARTGGTDPRTGQEINPEKRSSGSQFYFVHTDTSCVRLNGEYTVYGQIVEGIDVNLSLTVNYTGQGPLPGTEQDKIVRAWVEYL